MIDKLVVTFFKKVEEEHGYTTKNKKAKFLVELVEKKTDSENTEINTYTISISTATRIYERYIENKDDGSTVKDNPLKDIMSHYLSFKNYNAFLKSFKNNSKEPKKSKSILRDFIIYGSIISLLIAIETVARKLV